MLEKEMQSTHIAAIRRANYGTRARLGMMLPSENTIAEPQIAAMLPPGVSLHTTRLQLNGSTRDLVSMIDRLEEATALLADAKVTRIAFHCTGVSMWSPEIVDEIARRVSSVTDIPLVITSEAVVDALRVLDARKIVLLTPYVQDTNDREVRFLNHRGITVLRERGLGIRSGLEMAAVEPEQWYREAIAMRDPAAEAYFLSCTTVRSTDVIEELERELGRPVITSNQAMVWSALRSCDIADAIPGYGRLLRDF
jgi:maleate isomerase